jgi:hypothetical protein
LRPPILSRIEGADDHQNLELTATRSILTYGVRIVLRAGNRAELDLLSAYFPPLWKESSSDAADKVFSLKVGKRHHQLFEDSELGTSSRSLRSVLEYFGTRLKAYVAEMARRRVFVHAGAVELHGKAIIIPGRSMSGKTSLVRELVRAGATYYSDEYAVLDMRGRVHPYPQPLAIRDAGSFAQKNRRVEEFGGVSGDTPFPIGLVVVTRYQSDTRWRPKQLSTGQGVLELLNNTIPARRKPEIVMPTLQRAVAAAVILKGPRGEAAETADLILRRLEKID